MYNKSSRKFAQGKLLGGATLAAIMATGSFVPAAFATTEGSVDSAGPQTPDLAAQVSVCGDQPVLAFNSRENHIVFTDANANQLRSIKPADYFGDIALLPGGDLFGITPDGVLVGVNPETGATLSRSTMTFTERPRRSVFWNSLSAIDEHRAYVGGQDLSRVYIVDFRTGVAAPSNYTFPGSVWPSGDYFDMGDGSILAAAQLDGKSGLYRLYQDGRSDFLGTIPTSYGLARAGTDLYIALGGRSEVRMISNYASLRPSNGEIRTTPVGNVSTVLWGATSSVESIYCPIVNPEVVFAPEGTTAEFDFAYAAGMDAASARFVADGQPAGASLDDDGRSLVVPGQGAWSVGDRGDFRFAPVAGFEANPTPVRYSANAADGSSSAVPSTLSVFYPSVSDVHGTGDEGSPITVAPALGEGVDAATVQFVDSESNQATGTSLDIDGEGVWSVNTETGAMTFTPVQGFSGAPAAQRYTAGMTHNAAATAIPARVSVSYPGLRDVSGSADQGTPVTIQAGLNDSMDPTTVRLIDGNTDEPATGPLVIEGEGTWTVDADTGAMTFSPIAGFAALPSQQRYIAQDRAGSTALPARVIAAYPDVVDHTAVGHEGAPVQIALDLEESIDPQTLTFVTDGSSAEPQRVIAVEGVGIWQMVPESREAVFIPAEGFAGPVEPVQFTARNSQGHRAIPAQLSVVFPQIHDIEGTGTQGLPVAVPVDLNEHVDPSSVVLWTGAESERQSSLHVEGEGIWSVTSEFTTITFSPEDGFEGQPTPIQYAATHTDGATAKPATVTVRYPNVAPVTATGDQGASIAVEPIVSGNADAATVRFYDAAADETVDSVTVEGEGTWTYDAARGRILFTPLDGFSGAPNPQSYTASNSEGYQAIPAMITLSYPDIDDVAGAGSQGEAVTVATDLGDSIDPQTVRIVDPVLREATDNEVLIEGEGTWSVVEGNIVFTPLPGFDGDPTPMRYIARDIHDNTALPASVTVRYPDVADVSGSGPQDEPVSIAPALDADAVATTVQLIDPNTGLATSDPVVVAGVGTWSVNVETGDLQFAPLHSFDASRATLQYTAQDQHGNFALPANVTVTYPDVDNVTGSGDQGTAVTVAPVLGETTLPSTVTFLEPATGEIAAGSVTVEGEGEWSIDAETGAMTFTPAEGFTGNPSEMSYIAFDAEGNQATRATVMIYYPDVVDLEARGNQGEAVAIAVGLADGMDPSTVRFLSNTDTEPFTDLAVPGEGLWQVDRANNSIVFTPEQGFQGDPTPVLYTADLGDGGTAIPATVTVRYPDVFDVEGEGTHGQPVTVPTMVDVDTVPGGVLLIDPANGQRSDVVEIPGQGVWTIDRNNDAVTFTPAAGFGGQPLPLHYVGFDEQGHASLPAVVIVTYVPEILPDGDSDGPVVEPMTTPVPTPVPTPTPTAVPEAGLPVTGGQLATGSLFAALGLLLAGSVTAVVARLRRKQAGSE